MLEFFFPVSQFLTTTAKGLRRTQSHVVSKPVHNNADSLLRSHIPLTFFFPYRLIFNHHNQIFIEKQRIVIFPRSKRARVLFQVGGERERDDHLKIISWQMFFFDVQMRISLISVGEPSLRGWQATPLSQRKYFQEGVAHRKAAFLQLPSILPKVQFVEFFPCFDSHQLIWTYVHPL